MSRKMVLLAVLACAVVATVAVAQTATETTVRTATGRILHAGNETIVIDVAEGENLGIRRFNLRGEHGIKFYNRQGNEIQVQDLRAGEIVTAQIPTTTEVSVVVTSEEIEEIKKADPAPAAAPAPAPAPAAAPAPAPAPEPEPAMLPSTGSPLPMILLLAVVMLAVAVTLTVLRRL